MQNHIEELINKEVEAWQPYVVIEVMKSIVANTDEEDMRTVLQEVNYFMDSDKCKYRLSIELKEDKALRV